MSDEEPVVLEPETEARPERPKRKSRKRKPKRPFPLAKGRYLGPMTVSRFIDVDERATGEVQEALGMERTGTYSHDLVNRVLEVQDSVEELERSGLVDAATWDAIINS